MARISDPGFTGSVGDLIFYKLSGKTYVRTKPGKVRQTRATKASAGEFGRASAQGAVVRSQMRNIIADPKDINMRGRLVAALYRWLLQLRDQKDSKAIQPAPLLHFQFTEQLRPLIGRWKVQLNILIPVTGVIQIKIPGFVPAEVMTAPKDTASALCRISTSVSDVNNQIPIGSDSADLIFEYNNKAVAAQTITFKLPTPKKSLVITAISLEYSITKSNYLAKNTNKNYMPSEIMDAKYL